MLFPIALLLISFACGISCFVFSLRLRLLQEPHQTSAETAAPRDGVYGQGRRVSATSILHISDSMRSLGLALLYGLPAIVALGIMFRFLQALNWSFLQMPSSLISLFVKLAPAGQAGAIWVLFIQSAWSIGVALDRFMAYGAARKQSRTFAPTVAQALREGNLSEAILICDRFAKSHLAKIVVAGLRELRANENSAPGEEIDAMRQALERAQVIEHAELMRGVRSLGVTRFTALLVGLFGLITGSVNIPLASGGINSANLGLAQALLPMTLGLLVAIIDAWMFACFTSRRETLDIEMSNSASELIDYARRKRTGRVRYS